MPFLDVVGGYPEGTGSEETHRRTVSPTTPVEPTTVRGRPRASWPIALLLLLTRRRRRLQAAGFAAIALLVLFAFMLPAHTVHIAVDGRTTTARSHSVDNAAIVEGAGVRLRPGDRIEAHADTLTVRRATNVRLTADGTLFAIRSQAQTIDELLARTGIALGARDSVLRDGTLVAPSAPITGLARAGDPAQQSLTIAVRRAVGFTVFENGQETQVRSSRETVATALRDVGVQLGPGDGVQPPLSTAVSAGLQVHVQHASELVVTLPEGKSIVYALTSTVGDALTQSGISLPAQYRLDPPAETVISAGLAVHVIGISELQQLETERIQSYVEYQPDPRLPRGTQRVVSGQDGVHYRQYEIVSEDGVQVSRNLSAEWDDPKPVDTIVYYSTAPVAAAAPAPAANWQDIVCSYDWDCAWAMAVIMCESGGNPDTYNAQGYVGLFQIWQGYGANLRDPATNIAAAYSLYQSGGRGNWPNCP